MTYLKSQIKEKMRTGIISKIILLWLILSNIGLGAAMQFPNRHGYLLPWEMIVKNFNDNTSLWAGECVINSNGSKKQTADTAGNNYSSSYTCQPDKSIIVCLPTTISNLDPLNKISVISAKYDENSWQRIGEVNASLEQDVIKIVGGMSEEGFFKFSCALKRHDGELHNFDAYAIVCRNWKKDILAFCRELKNNIELNPDAQLIGSCIASSHFDHTMKLISKAADLSDKVLRALSAATKSKRDFDSGKCPDLVVGINKIRLKRFVGSPIEEFVALIPDDYTNSKPWPVFVHADFGRWATRNDYSLGSGLIDLWWHTVSFKNISWKDYTAVMEIMEQKLNIDRNRIYVEGECRNGLDAAALALNYPDQWAECSIVLGNSYRYLAGNALNLPLIFVKGGHNNDPYIGFYSYTVKCFEYCGCRHFKYSSTQNVVQARGMPIPETVRDKRPRRVSYAVESLRNPRAYWVEIYGREDENLIGTVDASVDGQTILVKTSNVDAYSLDLERAPLDSNSPVEIIENGMSLGLVTDRIFTKRSQKYVHAAYIKNERLHGPVWDAFTDPYVVVYGTRGGDALFLKSCRDFAKTIAQQAPCITDVDMKKKMTSDHNLILVGSVESNRWLAQISERLPLQIRSEQVFTTQGKNIDGNDLGFIVIYPNPMNPDKYVVVFSATSEKAMANMFNAYSQMKSSIPADVGIYEVTKQGNIKWYILEKLNTVWNWHGEYDKVLTTVGRNHPEWQWRQLVAHVVKKQMRVDVVICEDHLRNLDALSPGEKTYRDLFNAFKNVWFTKVKINGKSLRALLMVPFTDISKRDVDTPVIEGASLLKNVAGTEEKVLALSELVDETIYTAALPEKCLNGERIGLVLQDYDIVDQKYFMPLLKKYLISNSELDIDNQLDDLTFNIY
jgi:hypothetical protein